MSEHENTDILDAEKERMKESLNEAFTKNFDAVAKRQMIVHKKLLERLKDA